MVRRLQDHQRAQAALIAQLIVAARKERMHDPWAGKTRGGVTLSRRKHAMTEDVDV